MVLAFPGAKSLLVEQELEREKEKERARVSGEETPSPAAGWEQPPVPALVPVLWKEQQRGKGAEALSHALRQEPSPSW